jgi:uncharacterized protein (TIGR02611 family)
MKAVRRFAVTLVGAAIVVLGIALMVLPGPGFLILAVGLAILATEYAWARRLLDRTRHKAQEAQRTAVASPLRTAGTVVCALILIGLGVLAFVAPDLPLASPWTGAGLIIGGVVLLTTTWLTYRQARHEPSTYSSR